MGVCYLIQRNNLSNVESRPSRFKRLIDVASRLSLCLSRNIIATDKEDSGVDKYKLPERNRWRRSIGSVCRDGTALRQYLHVSLDVRSESDFNDVMEPIGSQSPDSLHQLFTSKQNLVCSCTRSNFLVTFCTESGDNSCSRLMR